VVTKAKHFYEFGTFRLSPEERQLVRGGDIVPLTPKTFDLLLVLLENSGHLIEKDELMKRLWPDSFVEEANLSVNVCVLRRVLGEAPNDYHYIETVPRRGYRFVAQVKERRGFGSRRLRQTVTGKTNPVQIQALAVLPLENLSADSSQEYFADGMTER
jgi:DNA-binding winged helix-turn-helix (wHTH) protein